jgi:hypothetical protein
MKLHPRTQPVAAASAAIRQALVELQTEHDLTWVEMLRILGEHQERLTKQLLRSERHPDNPGRKGDEACDALCCHDLPEPADACSDCGRAARGLQPWHEDVDGTNQITAWLGPSCYRRRLDALRDEATGGHVCQPFPIGGGSR